MTSTTEKTIGEMVADDYRTAAVFTSFGIDFCCKGNRTLDEVCESNKIAPEQLLQELQAAIVQQGGTATNYQSWPIDLLADYIEKTHHRYVAEKMPVLVQYLQKLCKVHGQRHPELFEIAEEFMQSANELANHMKKEEMILFPYVRQLAVAKTSGEKAGRPAFGTVQNPIRMMMDEHSAEGERFARISELSGQYTAPADGCTTYRVAFDMLKEFEQDLHLHIHLENNILFPKAIEMEAILN